MNNKPLNLNIMGREFYVTCPDEEREEIQLAAAYLDRKIQEIKAEGKVIDSVDDIDAIGHRAVHGGEEFASSVMVTDKVINKMKELIDNKEQAQKLIDEGIAMFEPRPNGEGVCFTMEAIKDESNLYRKLSDLIYNSDLNHDTAYTFVNEALEVLREVLANAENENDLQDAISEQVDSYTPIYNNDVMDFVKDNPYLVDEAIAEMGKRDSLIEDGQSAYYLGLERMVNEVAEIIIELL